MSANREVPSSKLDDIPALLRGAVENEIQPQTQALAELRTALDTYEAALRFVAEARVTGKVAAVLGLPVPEMPDASEARHVLMAAMGTLAKRAGLVTEPEGGGEKLEENRDGLSEAPVAAEAPDVEAAMAVPRAEQHEHELDDDVPAEAQKNGTALSQKEVRAFFETRAAAPPPSRPSSPSNHERELQALRSLLHRAGDTVEPTSDPDGVVELDALDEITADTTPWTMLSTPVQHLWLSYLVARTRALKDWLDQHNPVLKKRLHDVIVRLPTFSKETRPGHVNGMRPDHVPVRVSWAADADALLGELRELAYPERATAVPVEQVSKPQRKKVTTRDGGSAEPEPVDWPLRARVGAMRIVLFGGEPREEARRNLQRTLGIGTLDWPESSKPRRVDALAASISNGKLDVLLVLRGYVAHTESSKLVDAAKASRTPFGFVESGYGIAAIREAIEAALTGR